MRMGAISCFHGGGAAAHFSGREWNLRKCGVQQLQSTRWRPSKITCEMLKPSTYSSQISTDIPLYESPQATFDQYLENKPRVFKAMFPDKRRSQQLNEVISKKFRVYRSALRIPCTMETPQEEWRVHMLPLQFGFLTAFPVIDMRLRCKSQGTDYPPGVPRDITKVLELDILRWDLQGLEIPSQFSLGIEGALYPDRRGPRSRLKGQLKITISYIVPPVLALLPEDMRRDIAEKVLGSLVENMKDKVNSSLLADYTKFKKERLLRLV